MISAAPGYGRRVLSTFGPATALACAALVLLAAGGLLLAAPEADGVLVLNDSRTRRTNRAIHDVEKVEIRAAKGRLHVELTFAVPLLKGIFTRATLRVDCDDNASTGIRGEELHVLASVGSRYRRTSSPADDTHANAAIDMRRTTYRRVVTGTDRTSRAHRKEWLNQTHPGLAPPAIDGNRFSFSLPLSLLHDNGMLYNNAIRLQVEVEGTICEELISVEHVCGDAGLVITLDGKSSDWPAAGRKTRDATGELHPATGEVDLEEIQVEHDKDHLFARVKLATRGFGRAPSTDDIRDMDSVTVGLEPLGDGGYMRFIEAVAFSAVPVRRSSSRLSPYEYHARDGTIEFAIRRRPEQTRFRVIVWSDAHRIDYIPNRGRVLFRIPKSAWSED